MRLPRKSAPLAAAIMLVLVGLGCGGGSSPATETASVGSDGVPVVEMKDISYMPDSITVKVNTTVRWVNNDPVAHTVTEDNGLFDSGLMDNGAIFEQSFDDAGTYNYTCKIHPTTMKGTVIVEQ